MASLEMRNVDYDTTTPAKALEALSAHPDSSQPVSLAARHLPEHSVGRGTAASECYPGPRSSHPIGPRGRHRLHQRPRLGEPATWGRSWTVRCWLSLVTSCRSALEPVSAFQDQRHQLKTSYTDSHIAVRPARV